MSERYSVEELESTRTVIEKAVELIDILFDEDDNGNRIGEAVSFMAGMSIGMSHTLSRFIIRQYLKHQEEQEYSNSDIAEVNEEDEFN